MSIGTRKTVFLIHNEKQVSLADLIDRCKLSGVSPTQYDSVIIRCHQMYGCHYDDTSYLSCQIILPKTPEEMERDRIENERLAKEDRDRILRSKAIKQAKHKAKRDLIKKLNLTPEQLKTLELK